MTLNAYLILATILFCIGLIGVIRRKNVLMLFFSTEIMLNAVNVGFAAISKFHGDLTGQMFAFFIIADRCLLSLLLRLLQVRLLLVLDF